MATKKMPEVEIYERGLEFWPYKTSLAQACSMLAAQAPRNAVCVDLMTGSGYLPAQLLKLRGDLRITGVDIDPKYVAYGRETYPGITFEEGDVCTWQPVEPVDVVFCTGALHHVVYGHQETAIRNIASMVKPMGLVMITDSYIDGYETEEERQFAAAYLGNEYLKAAIRNRAPYDVLAATAEITRDDVCRIEYKTSIYKRLPVLKSVFPGIQTIKVWPFEALPGFISGYGDYIHVWQGH